jgi:hypothetical protein
LLVLLFAGAFTTGTSTTSSSVLPLVCLAILT